MRQLRYFILILVAATVLGTASPAIAVYYRTETETRAWVDNADGTGREQVWTRIIGVDEGSEWVEIDWTCEGLNFWEVQVTGWEERDNGEVHPIFGWVQTGYVPGC